MSARDGDIDWYIVKRDGNYNPLGALGFIDDEVAIISSFYDDRDANKDGKVSVPERVVHFISPLRTEGIAVVEVAMTARFDMNVLERDPDFYMTALNLWFSFARNLVIDGAYTAWMGVGINMATGIVAKQLAEGLVKQFVIKKGMEAIVKTSMKKAMGRD